VSARGGSSGDTGGGVGAGAETALLVPREAVAQGRGMPVLTALYGMCKHVGSTPSAASTPPIEVRTGKPEFAAGAVLLELECACGCELVERVALRRGSRPQCKRPSSRQARRPLE
jgi:hypothetical protein